MKHLNIVVASILFWLLSCSSAYAWFFFIPGSLLDRLSEKDPESIAVSTSDRSLGKCAGFHVNQAKKYRGGSKDPTVDSGGMPMTPISGDAKFHFDMAELAAERATEKLKIPDLGYAYSGMWNRAARVDRNSNFAFGADLAKNCSSNDIPIRIADLPAWQTRQEDKKRLQAEEGQHRQAEEARKESQLQEEQKSKTLARPENSGSSVRTNTNLTAPPVQTIDFSKEAYKSAQILGCNPYDVRVIGVDGQNILFSANCRQGQSLLLTCDPAGLCLKK